MKCLKFLCLYLAFTLEVQVHATAAAAPVLDVQVPVHCMEHKEFPCAVRMAATFQQRKMADALVSGAPGTIFIFASAEDLRFVKGEAVLQAQQPLEVRFLYGTMHIPAAAQILVQKKAAFVNVTVLQGSVQITRLGLAEKDILPAGFWVQIGPMKMGSPQISWPEAFDYRNAIQALAYFSGSNISALRENLSAIREHWVVALEHTAHRTQSSVIETLSQEQAEAERLRRLKLQTEAENLRLRKMFRERNYF